MDTDKILNLPKEHRKTFVVLLCALVLIALLLDWKISSLPFVEALLGYVRSVAAAVLTSLFILWIAVSFFPAREKVSISEIEARKITEEFDQLLSTASRWRYKGNFGRYMRSKVLPSLAGRQNAHISACVIDPSIENLCEKHAKYRSQINSIDKGRKYDADTVALEVLVTIVICAWYVANRKINIDLYLSPYFDPVRIDSNDEAMILTVEDRRSPALKVTCQHFTYEHFELQMEYARNQSKKVTLEGVRECAQADITKNDIESVLENAGMKALCEKITPHKILRAVKESKNPYEN